MISGRELAYGVVGAWRLIRNDPAGPQYFDRSIDGARRSFWVMALLAPANVVLAMMLFDSLHVEVVTPRLGLLVTLYYVIDWLYFPVLVLRVAPMIGRGAGFAGYVASYNYMQIPICALTLAVNALADQAPDGVAVPLGMAFLAVVSLIHFRLLRRMLDIPPPQAALMVLAGISLSFALNSLMHALLLGGMAPPA